MGNFHHRHGAWQCALREPIRKVETRADRLDGTVASSRRGHPRGKRVSKEDPMGKVFPEIVLALADNIRRSLERAEATNDIAELRSALAEIKRNIDEMVASAKAAEER